jgi:hypothetical protein
MEKKRRVVRIQREIRRSDAAAVCVVGDGKSSEFVDFGGKKERRADRRTGRE